MHMDNPRREELQERGDRAIFTDITQKIASAAAELARRNKKHALDWSQQAMYEDRQTLHSIWDKSVAGREVIYDIHGGGDTDRYHTLTIEGPSEELLVVLIQAELIDPKPELHYKAIRFVVNDPRDAAANDLPEVLMSAMTWGRALDDDPKDMSYEDFDRLTTDGGLYKEASEEARIRRNLIQKALLDEFPDMGDG